MFYSLDILFAILPDFSCINSAAPQNLTVRPVFAEQQNRAKHEPQDALRCKRLDFVHPADMHSPHTSSMHCILLALSRFLLPVHKHHFAIKLLFIPHRCHDFMPVILPFVKTAVPGSNSLKLTVQDLPIGLLRKCPISFRIS